MSFGQKIVNIEEINDIKKDSEDVIEQVKKSGFNSDLIECDKKLVDKIKTMISRLKKDLCTLETMWPHIDEMMDLIEKIDYVSFFDVPLSHIPCPRPKIGTY